MKNCLEASYAENSFADTTELQFSNSNIRKLHFGKKSFMNATSLIIENCDELEEIVVHEKAFGKKVSEDDTSKRPLIIRNCKKLRSIEFSNGTFRSFSDCCFESKSNLSLKLW